MRILLTVAFVCAALPALADPATTTTSTTPPAATDNPDQLICHRKAPPTGSFIMPKPECHTRAEWAAHPNGNAPDAGSGVSTYGGIDTTGHGSNQP
ncbi:MAG TPA: hypothetical protein VGU69_12425 [Rhizomicrobium sp.]|nr:hypothetical protein [Rhizomicrobium sp.]